MRQTSFPLARGPLQGGRNETRLIPLARGQKCKTHSPCKGARLWKNVVPPPCSIGHICVTCISFQHVGKPSPPVNLTLQLPAQGLGVTLSWQPGFAHQGESVTFVITSQEVVTGNEVESNTSMTSITLVPSSQMRSCQQYNFTVYSQNLFSRSPAGISEVTFVPTSKLTSIYWKTIALYMTY